MTDGEIAKLVTGSSTYLLVSLAIALALLRRIDKLIAIVGRIAEKKTSSEKDQAPEGEKNKDRT